MLLFLSDVGGSEIFLILLVILIFFGPKSIPGIAKTFAKTIYQIKQASDDIKKEVAKSGMDIKKDLNFDKIIDRAGKGIEEEIIQPMQKEVNEVDKTLYSVSYTKPNHNSAYKGEAELELEREEAEALKAEEARATQSATETSAQESTTESEA